MPYCNQCGNLVDTGDQVCPHCATPVNALARLAPMPPPTGSDAVTGSAPLASYWWRVLGYVIDEVILGLVISYPLRALHVNAYATAVLVAILTFFYGTLLLTYMRGQTLGMRLVRVRVVSAQGASVTRFEAAKRTVLYCALSLVGNLYHYTKYAHPSSHERSLESHHALLSLIFSIPIFLDLLWPLWDKRRQTLADKFANTVVVR